MDPMKILLVVVGIIIALLIIITCVISFHQYCKERYGVSPFRIGSMLSLLLMDIILISTLSIWHFAADQGKVDVTAMYILFGVCGAIFIINLAKNIKRMGSIAGTIGTISATLVSAGIIFLLVTLMPESKKRV